MILSTTGDASLFPLLSSLSLFLSLLTLSKTTHFDTGQLSVVSGEGKEKTFGRRGYGRRSRGEGGQGEGEQEVEKRKEELLYTADNE